MFQFIARYVLDLLFPPQCVGCGRDGTWLCRPCLSSVKPMEMLRPTPEVDRLICLGSYDLPLLTQAVQRLKYHGGQTLAEPLGRALSSILPKRLREAAIVPVPLHPTRQRERGFNQSALIANAMCINQDQYTESVRRVRRTVPQVSLDEAGRQANVQDAFELIPGLEIIPKHAIIVDDVFTTGATISAVARVLRTAGTMDITAVTVAKG